MEQGFNLNAPPSGINTAKSINPQVVKNFGDTLVEKRGHRAYNKIREDIAENVREGRGVTPTQVGVIAKAFGNTAGEKIIAGFNKEAQNVRTVGVIDEYLKRAEEGGATSLDHRVLVSAVGTDEANKIINQGKRMLYNKKMKDIYNGDGTGSVVSRDVQKLLSDDAATVQQAHSNLTKIFGTYTKEIVDDVEALKNLMANPDKGGKERSQTQTAITAIKDSLLNLTQIIGTDKRRAYITDFAKKLEDMGMPSDMFAAIGKNPTDDVITKYAEVLISFQAMIDPKQRIKAPRGDYSPNAEDFNDEANDFNAKLNHPNSGLRNMSGGRAVRILNDTLNRADPTQPD